MDQLPKSKVVNLNNQKIVTHFDDLNIFNEIARDSSEKRMKNATQKNKTLKRKFDSKSIGHIVTKKKKSKSADKKRSKVNITTIKSKSRSRSSKRRKTASNSRSKKDQSRSRSAKSKKLNKKKKALPSD